MRFVNVVTVCLAVCLVVGMVSVSPSVFAVQPPVDTSTLYVGTIGWGPRRADPVRAYDSGSMGLIFNVYDTLISFKGELYWEFEPCLAVNVPSKDEGTIVNVTKRLAQWMLICKIQLVQHGATALFVLDGLTIMQTAN